ncbi:MAG: ankyrin repeat domain-containing protein [Planctomycetaceae bacterium]|jgi:ankyrin repeat protein|nr:ankyrin repeat domain-containing protein [Planctomycetaceae bacterium]
MKHRFLMQYIDGDLKSVKYMVEQGADINAADLLGTPPLCYAAQKNSNVDVLKFLIEKGADINATDEFGMTPLYAAAAFNSNVGVLKFLIEKGADINATDKLGMTPLDAAKSEEVKKILRDAGGKSGMKIK